MITDYLKEAEVIRDEYKNRARRFSMPFNDAVIEFLFLFASWMFSKKTK